MAETDEQRPSEPKGGSKPRSRSQPRRGSPKAGSEATAKDTAPEKADEVSKGYRELLGPVAVALSVLALIASGFAWYQVAVTARLAAGQQSARLETVSDGFTGLREAQQAARDEVSVVSRRLGEVEIALREEVDALRRKLDEDLSAQNRQRDADLDVIRGDFSALSSSVERIYEELGRTVDSWLLEEIQQLLLLASQRVSLARDAVLAKNALQLADRKLEDLGDPELIPVRREIASEIQALGAVPTVDVEGIALRLSTLMDGVGQLPLRGDDERPDWTPGDGSSESVGDEEDWSDVGQKILDDLSQLVRVRNVEQTKAPKLDQSQRYLAFESLRLMLSAAQLALLKSESGAFHESVGQSLSWLEDYFDLDAPEVKSFRADLTELADVEIAPTLPEIGRALALLSATMKDRGEAQ